MHGPLFTCNAKGLAAPVRDGFADFYGYADACAGPAPATEEPGIDSAAATCVYVGRPPEPKHDRI